MSSLFLSFLISSAIAGAMISSLTAFVCFWVVRQKVMSDWAPHLKPMIQNKTFHLIDKIKAMFPFAAAFLGGNTGESLRSFAENEMIAMIPEVQVEVLAQLNAEIKWIFLVAMGGALLGIVTMFGVFYLAHFIT